MSRTLLALLAFLLLSQTAHAVRINIDVPSGKRGALIAYAIEVKKSVSAAMFTIKNRRGAADLGFQVLASGRVAIDWVKASDQELERLVREKIRNVRVPPPPAWAHPPLRFTVPIVFH